MNVYYDIVTMRMKDIPWFNRPWTKLKRKGPAALDDAELLAMIMMRGNEKENVLELSNKLLSKHNLHYLSSCSLKELTVILGDEIKAYQIQGLAELCKRYAMLKKRGFQTTLETAQDVYHHFHEELKDKKKEHLYAILLNSKNKIIKKDLVSVGTLNQSFSHPREVFKTAIKESANALILVHNHPSGDPKASKEDVAMTKKLIRAGNLLGIKVLDHVIIGQQSYWSLMESR